MSPQPNIPRLQMSQITDHLRIDLWTALHTWESITEWIPSEKIALVSTHSQTCLPEKRSKEVRTKANPRTLVGLPARDEEGNPIEMELKEARDHRERARNPPGKDHQPGCLLIAISQECLQQFMQGYQDDVVLRPHCTAWNDVKSGSDPRGTPNADGSGVRGVESNTGVGSDREHAEGMSMDARIRLRVDKHAGGPWGPPSLAYIQKEIVLNYHKLIKVTTKRFNEMRGELAGGWHSMDGVLFHVCSLNGLWLIHDNYPSSIPVF